MYAWRPRATCLRTKSQTFRSLRRDAAGDDGGAAGGQLVEDADVEVAVEGEREGARDGRGGHDEDVGLGVL
jgi:hypothetical protein